MKKMSSKTMYKKSDKEEFYFLLSPGEAFLSFHHAGGENVGFFFNKFDFTQTHFHSALTKAKEHFAERFHQVEVKFVGNTKNVKEATTYLEAEKKLTLKMVTKDEAIELVYLPAESRVRIAKDSVKEAPKATVTPFTPRPAVLDRKIKVLIVDDSKTIRNILSKIFMSDSSFEVCAMAELPSEVEPLILKHKPDVITLDIHMPEMDGVTLLKTVIAPKFHIPTVMISSISMAEGPLVLEALENGAVDYIQKPEMSEIKNVTPLILEKVKTAALANMSKKATKVRSAPKVSNGTCDMNSLIVLGASTGGTEAIRDILTALPKEIPAMLIVQHIPAIFSLAFAKRMNDLCPFEVKEAQDGDEVRANRVLIAPGGFQMKMVKKGGKVYVEINDDAPVNRFKPSVDYMFMSVAENLYTHTVGVILTGMGKDGAKGMLELHKKGVKTIAQDEETSVVFGMPKEAIALGGAEFIDALPNIADRIVEQTHPTKKTKSA